MLVIFLGFLYCLVAERSSEMSERSTTVQCWHPKEDQQPMW